MEDYRSTSTAELVSKVADDLRVLVRKELELARIELLEGLRAQLLGAGLIAVAVFMLLLSLPFFAVALALFIADVSALTTAGGFAILGLVLVVLTGAGVGIGIWRMRSRRPTVEKTMTSLKEDVRWAREHLTR